MDVKTGGPYKVNLDTKEAQQAVGASVQIFWGQSAESGQLVQNKAHTLPDNIVLTDSHLLADGNGVMKIQTSDGKAYAGRLLKIDQDVAWVQVENLPKGLPHVEIGDPSDVPALSNLKDKPAFVMGVGHDQFDENPTVYGGEITGVTSKAEQLKRADQINAQDPDPHGLSTTYLQDYQAMINGLSPKDRQEAQADLDDPRFETKLGCTNGGSGGQMDSLTGKLIGLCESSVARGTKHSADVRETYTTLAEIRQSLGSADGPNADKALLDSSEFTFEYEQKPNFDASISGLTMPSLVAIRRKNNDPRPPFNARTQIQEILRKRYHQ